MNAKHQVGWPSAEAAMQSAGICGAVLAAPLMQQCCLVLQAAADLHDEKKELLEPEIIQFQQD